MSETEWSWYRDEGTAYGPFPTREAAIDDASRTLELVGGTVLVGKVRTVHPEDWVSVDIEDLLNNADEQIGDCVYHDDYIFSVPNDQAKEAQEELNKFLEAWSKRWVNSDMSWYVTDGESVTIPAMDGGRERASGS